MIGRFNMRISLKSVVVLLISLLLFWAVLLLQIPSSFSLHFHAYSFWTFLVVLVLYYLSFRLPDMFGIPVSISLTMILFAITLSYKWTSGYSDNLIIGGLLPYKDGKNYYLGANLILNGLPMIRAGQATERPLFPGFLASVLLLTGQNLKIALAIIAQLTGIGLFLSARQVRISFGALAAGVYATLMYFYIQPLIGYPLSESLGFLSGCLGFTLLWIASHSRKRKDLLLGISVLMVAVSARAGAFFIFPMLVLWVGWIFREQQTFSSKAAVYAFISVMIGYFLFNSIYSHLLSIPSGSTFGNFSYALYGQVRGGTGWHSAIDELGTRNPSIVYRAALEYFFEHPISLFIGFAKAYRDFFLPGDRGIFPFWDYARQSWLNLVLWLGTIALLARGLSLSFKGIRSNLSSLLVAVFTGIFLSIPFLPPIDGGARFYASTMPFFFVLPAVAIRQLQLGTNQILQFENDTPAEWMIYRFGSAALLILVVIAPVAIKSLGVPPPLELPGCPSEQKPFILEFHPGSYLDLVKDGSSICGFIPDVCLDDFEGNNIELTTDDFYQVLLSLVKSDDSNARIIPASDLIENNFHYFYFSYPFLRENMSTNLLSGCAVELRTNNQSIYKVESILP